MSNQALERTSEALFAQDDVQIKTCPQCGQELFADMPVCYGCLYDFTRKAEPPALSIPELLVGQPDEGEPAEIDDGYSRMPEDRTADTLTSRSGLALFVQTGDIDLTMPLPDGGINIGRVPTNDVVLHSRAVSRHHVRIVPNDHAATIEDRGATNPAILHGREVIGTCDLRVGDTVDICGALLTLVSVGA